MNHKSRTYGVGIQY